MKNAAESARHIAKLYRKGALQDMGVALLDHQITMLEERCAHLQRKRLVRSRPAPLGTGQAAAGRKARNGVQSKVLDRWLSRRLPASSQLSVNGYWDIRPFAAALSQAPITSLRLSRRFERWLQHSGWRRDSNAKKIGLSFVEYHSEFIV